MREETSPVPSVEETVSFRAAFERYPASVKGAFLVSGADGMPHQVRIGSARVVELGSRSAERIGVEPAILEVAPTAETFVPFEVPTLDLRPGWYQLECEVTVDAIPGIVRPGKRFAIAWPRSQVRRGIVPIDRAAGKVTWGSLECMGDCVRVSYAADAAPDVTMTVDGRTHPVLGVEHDAAAGKGRVLGYPVLRGDERLSISGAGTGATPLEIALP